MDKRVKAFLDKKRKEDIDANGDKKAEILISLGLYDKVYSPTNEFDEEYYFSEWDEATQETKVYKKVPYEVTDEEFAEILKYCEKPKKPISRITVISRYLTLVEIFMFLFGLIIGINEGTVYNYYDEPIFHFNIASKYWIAYFSIGALFTALKEIINSLNDIKNK